MINKVKARKIRQLRARKTIVGTPERPRLNVFKSNKHLNVQIIDDTNHKTLVSTSTKTLDLNNNSIAEAKMVGEQIATLALEAGITSVVFDRGGNRYHGKIQALADAARAKGLQF